MGSAWGGEGLPVVGVVVGQVACQRACPASRAAAADLRWPPVRPWTYAPYCSLLPPLTHFAHCLALATNLLTISHFFFALSTASHIGENINIEPGVRSIVARHRARRPTRGATLQHKNETSSNCHH